MEKEGKSLEIENMPLTWSTSEGAKKEAKDDKKKERFCAEEGRYKNTQNKRR